MTMNVQEPDSATVARKLRDCFGSYATGVTVVTARSPQGQLIGLTVNSFTSVSLEPPLILISLGKTVRSLQAFSSAAFFGINILRADQERLSSHFAKAGDDKWKNVTYTDHVTGVPLISRALAAIVCERYATHDAGDHIIEIGRVLESSLDASGEPLVFHRGRYRRLML